MGEGPWGEKKNLWKSHRYGRAERFEGKAVVISLEVREMSPPREAGTGEGATAWLTAHQASPWDPFAFGKVTKELHFKAVATLQP